MIDVLSVRESPSPLRPQNRTGEVEEILASPRTHCFYIFFACPNLALPSRRYGLILERLGIPHPKAAGNFSARHLGGRLPCRRILRLLFGREEAPSSEGNLARVAPTVWDANSAAHMTDADAR